MLRARVTFSWSTLRVGHEKVVRFPFCTCPWLLYQFLYLQMKVLYLRYATGPGYFFVAHSVLKGRRTVILVDILYWMTVK